MSWVAVAVVGVAAVGTIVSNMSAADREEALQNKAFREFINIHIPDPAQQRLALQRFKVEGKLTPELESAIKAPESEFSKIAVDQSQKASQNRALQQLEQIGSDGGLRLQDKAALQDAQMQAEVQDRGARNAILDDMNRRGQGGSGMALQAQLQGQQAAGDRAARSGLSIAAQAQERALNAIMGAGDLATKYRSQDFQEQSEKAKAADSIARFNTQGLRDVQSANVGAINRANEYNLTNQQRIADNNVELGNNEQKYNKELIQKRYENEMDMARAKGGIYTQQGATEARRGQQEANAFTNVGQGVSGAITANNAGQTAQYDPQTGKKYKYDPKTGRSL